MTAADASLADRPPVAAPDAVPTGAGMGGVYQAELQKLTAQLATRLLAVICVLGPFAFAGVLRIQSGSPGDTLFGFWVHSSGFAIALVVLGFAANWGFPLMAGILAGDLFSSEDRHGTWKTILTRSVAREELFAGKVLAATSAAATLLALTALSSIVAGLLLVGDQPLLDLSGLTLSSGRTLALVLVSWLVCLLPLLAYTSLAVLFSIATRNGIVGVLGPLLVALVTQLLDLVGKGVWMHMLLPASAFDGWHGLFVTHRFYGPLVISSLVSIIWIVACLGASWAILRRRDFLNTAAARVPGWLVAVRVVVIGAALMTLLALAGNLGPVGITAARLRAAITPEFNNITLLQQQLIGRRVPAGAGFTILPNCNRRGAKPEGPGDWQCTLNVYLPQPGSVPYQLSAVEYDISVQYNGCYKAQSPPAFIGGPTMRDAHGKTVPNPLFVVYGCFNTL
ncbi:MAG: ABC transporter permease [Solirubrobacteraceae bacterium]